MKQLFIIAALIVGRSADAQVNVFDCNAYTGHLTQAEIDAAQDHFGACIVMGEQQSVDISGSDNRNVYAAKQIHLKEDFHAGGFTSEGQLHLKIAEQNSLELAVMNYPDLNSVLRYKKLELGVQLPADVLTRVNRFLLEEGVHADELNPFVEWDVDVEATFYHAASGTFVTIDGYYHREYIENETTNDWDDIGTDYPFRIRYAPPQNGKWIATVSIKIDGQSAYASEWFGFQVVESGDSGYVSVHPNRKNLVRGGEMIFPVGHNFPAPEEHGIPWGGDTATFLGNNLFSPQNSQKATNTLEWDFYMDKVESYFQQGGKYIRTIQTPWSSLIEYEKKGNYYDRLHYAWEQDKLLDLCEQYDALVMFNMLMHTVLEEYDPYHLFIWDWNHRSNQEPYDNNHTYPVYCYNATPQEFNGKKPHEALINEDDLSYHEQRTRYYIARYGYSTKIYEFELLSEPFNVNNNALTKDQPYGLTDTPEQQELFTAIEAYHGRLSWYIKEKMKHTEHLIGVDYTLLSWNKHTEDIRMDQSLHHGNIDIIGVNYYANSPNKYIVAKDGDNNAYHNSENTRARAVKEFQEWADKPVILSEFGDGDGVHECSNYIGSYVDLMAAGFTGVCGYNLWEGKDLHQNFLWPATIRAQHHMNGNDVISTLSNGDGNWIQGRQDEKIYGSHKAQAKELQYYISQNKERAVGYVRNRSYNPHTKRINENCNMLLSDDIETVDNFDDTPIDNLYNIAWNDGTVGRRLKIQGLKNNTDYQVDWYSFKEGTYLFSECQSTGWISNSLVLRFPDLTVTPGYTERPVVWFVVHQRNCQQGMMPPQEGTVLNLDENYQLRAREETEGDDFVIQAENPEPSMIYPNPFEDFFVINSINKDLLLLHSIDGTQVGSYNIPQGVTKITTIYLSKGVYIVSLQEQGKQFKIIKK